MLSDTSGWQIASACLALSAATLVWWLKKGNTVKREYHMRVQRRQEQEQRRRGQLLQQLTDGGQQLLMTEDRCLIVELETLPLLHELKDGQLTAVKVLEAYQAKALEVTTRHNCITEFIWNAQSVAAELDRRPANQRGPLHGLPVSIKDNVDVEGYDSTAGLAKFLDSPAKRTAPLVQTLIGLGAVPFCKTNLPQTMISYGCSNPVWGITPNLYDRERVPGGSSGGEGVLVAAGGSPLGVGSDIGGSVRVPALFSGCYGLKPTVGRLSGAGLRASLPATIGVRGTPGFLARDIAGLKYVTELVTSPRPSADMYRLDPLIPRVYWNGQLAEADITRIGYITEFPFFPVTPGVARALTQTVDALEATGGYQLVPFSMPVDATSVQLFCQVVQPENGFWMLESVKDEVIDKSIDTYITLLRIPFWLRDVLAWATEGRFRYLPPRLRAKTLTTVDAVQAAAAKKQFVDQVVSRWRAERIDVLLLPAFMCPAPPREMVSNLVFGGVYSSIFNLLDFPAAVLNVTQETEEDQQTLDRYPTSGQVDLRWVVEATRGALGQPLGVQLVALPWMEEQLLTALEQVQTALDRKRRPAMTSGDKPVSKVRETDQPRKARGNNPATSQEPDTSCQQETER